MKKQLFLIILLVSAIIYKASSQNCTTDFLATKTLYKKPLVKYTPLPNGYQPFFINHVGRHGARHLTKDVNTSFAYQLLAKADSITGLTVAGEKLRQMVIDLDKIEKGNTKSISDEGRLELQGIGQRIYALYKPVFKGTEHFNVAVTKEIRTKQSADAFLVGLKKDLKDSVVINFFNDDTNLRFYDFSPAYKKYEQDGEWLKYREELEKAQHIATIDNELLTEFFKPGFKASINADDADKFVNDIFGFATIVYSVQNEVRQAGFKPADVNFKQLFTCEQITALSIIGVADDYYQKGPGLDNNGIQVRIAAPLLANFIKTSDEALKTPSVNAQLRFAHAETISPIAALMEISIANKASKNSSGINKIWSASKVIPLSSNIQWIFYKKAGSEKYLVKILLNEKEAHITGMPAADFPYYQWGKLREFYMRKLKMLNVNLTDDMKAYLTNLK